MFLIFLCNSIECGITSTICNVAVPSPFPVISKSLDRSTSVKRFFVWDRSTSNFLFEFSKSIFIALNVCFSCENFLCSLSAFFLYSSLFLPAFDISFFKLLIVLIFFCIFFLCSRRKFLISMTHCALNFSELSL